MKSSVLSVAGLLVLSACTFTNDDQAVDQVENAIREDLASRGNVKQVELERESDDRMTGFALVEPRDAPGSELRFACAADRQGDTGTRFNWRCTPPVQQAAADGAPSQPAGGKDPQAGQLAATPAAAGPGPMALVGRWTDTGDCTTVTLLGEDGVFIAPNGGRGNWDIQGSQLTFTGPGGSASWSVFLQDPNTLVLTSADGSVSQSSRC